jgi:hypothetical protein
MQLKQILEEKILTNNSVDNSETLEEYSVNGMQVMKATYEKLLNKRALHTKEAESKYAIGPVRPVGGGDVKKAVMKIKTKTRFLAGSFPYMSRADVELILIEKNVGRRLEELFKAYRELNYIKGVGFNGEEEDYSDGTRDDDYWQVEKLYKKEYELANLSPEATGLLSPLGKFMEIHGIKLSDLVQESEEGQE